MMREKPGRLCDPGNGADVERTHLLHSPVGLVEHVCRHGVPPPLSPRAPAGFSPDFQVCLPYRGFFIWHVGGDDVVSDANQVLFVASGESYRVSEPVPGGYAELIITPRPTLLAELLDVPTARLSSHRLFRRRYRRADVRLQLLRARLLHETNSGTWDSLAAEELVVATLRRAIDADVPQPEPSPSTRRLIRRTKEFVEGQLTRPFRLNDVARAVDASPAYLTDVFRRFEGLPLHQYALQARLARALVELPHANDLTKLALDLGFSSHSHFAAAFHRAFGAPPSVLRRATRGRAAVNGR